MLSLSLSEPQNGDIFKYDFMPELYWILKPMPALLCIGFGQGKQTSIINKLFGTDFEHDDYLNYGSVDIQFDFNFTEPGRGFSVLKTDDKIPENYLAKFVKFSSMYLLIVSAEQITNYSQEITKLYELAIQNYPTACFMLLVEGAGQRDVSSISRSSTLLKSRYKLRNLAKLIVVGLPEEKNDDYMVTFECIQQEITKLVQKYIKDGNPKALSHGEFLQTFEMKDYREEIVLIENFMKIVESHSNNFYDGNFLPMYKNYLEFCKINRTIVNDQNIWQDQDRFNSLSSRQSELEFIMKNPKKVKISKILDEFVQSLSESNSFIILYAISKRLKSFVTSKIAQDKKVYFETKGLYHNLQTSCNQPKIENVNAMELEKEITNLSEALENKSLSLEIIWRELVQFYCFQRITLFNHYDEQKLIRVFSKYTLDGLPFEIIDGDNISMARQFMTKAIPQKHKKLLVVSIIGPQSSGKSTLLNYLFGCQFSTSSGRCTKGVYGTIFDCSFDGYDGLLILDTEGLFAPEKQDPEYDKKIVLFCMAVSHIVLINIRGDIHTNMQDVLAISLNALNKLNMSKVPCPTIFLVLNQNADPSIENHLKSIHLILEKLQEVVDDLKKLLELSDKTLFVLPSAFSNKKVLSDDSIESRWITLSPSDHFGDGCKKLFDKILHEAENRTRRNEDNTPFNTITEWNDFAQNVWTTIENFKELYRLNEIKEMDQKEKVNEKIIQFIKQEFETENVAKAHQDKLFEIVKDSQTKEQALSILQDYWFTNNFERLKPKWQDSLKDFNLTHSIKDRADYLFKHHLNAKRSYWESIVSSQFDLKEIQRDIANGNAKIKARVRTILTDHTRMINEQEAKQEFLQLFNEITAEMKEKKNYNDPKFKIKEQIYTQYRTLCKSLPELSSISESSKSLKFDPFISFCEKRDFMADVFTTENEKFLDLQKVIMPIEPDSEEGARIIFGLASVKWKIVFDRIRKGEDLENTFIKLDKELSLVGLGLTNGCFRELKQGDKFPTPKNTWLTFKNDPDSSKNPNKGVDFIDVLGFKKQLQEYSKRNTSLTEKKEKGILGFFSGILQYFQNQFRVDPEIDHTTWKAKENTRFSRWLINSISERQKDKSNLFKDLKIYACNNIQKVKIEELISSFVEKNMKDSQEVSISILVLINSEITALEKEIDIELSKIALELTLAGRGKLHELAFIQIVERILESIRAREMQYLNTWKSSKDHLEKFFLSQVLRQKNIKTDENLAKTIINLIEQKMSEDAKIDSQKRYNSLVGENKYLFSRERIQELTDAFLVKTDKEIVARYILDPIAIFEQEFEREWAEFIRRIDYQVLKSYRDAGQMIDLCVIYLDDILSQLKAIYEKVYEDDIFEIRVGNMKLELNPEESKKLQSQQQQAKSEAPFKCLTLFIKGDNYKNFTINQVDVEAKLNLINNVELKPEAKKVLNLIINDNYQIYRFNHFLNLFILELRKLSNKFKQFTFNNIELNLGKDTYHAIAIGCTQICPICKRICDAIHGNNPGDTQDKHQCKRGHQYCAMAGVHWFGTRKACLLSCNDQTPDRKWICADRPTTWGDMRQEGYKKWMNGIMIFYLQNSRA